VALTLRALSLQALSDELDRLDLTASGGVIRDIIGSFVPLDGTSLPTSDPHVVGQVWANVGVLTISAG
jgi:hypothetical protein